MQVDVAATGRPEYDLPSRTTMASVALLAAATAVTVALLPLPWAALVIFAAGTLALTLIRLDFGIYILVFAIPLGIPFSSVLARSAGNLPLAAGEILVPVLLLSWLVRLNYKRHTSVHFHVILWPVLILVGFLIYSATIASSLSLALKEVSRWLELAVVFLIAINELKTERQVRLLVVMLIVAGLAEALLGWYQFFTRDGPQGFLLGGWFLRAYGTFKQPNPYAGYLGLIIPLVYGLVLARSHNGVPRLRPRLRFLALALFMLVAASAMSASRGAWLAAFVALSLMSIYRSRRFVMPMVFVILLLATLIMLGFTGLLPQQLKSRLAPATQYFTIFDAREAVVTPENWSIVERMAIWQAAWEMYQEHRVLGIGAGNFKELYPDYALPRWQYEAPHAHNYYLNILAETGIVGLAIYSTMLISILGFAWVMLRRVWRRPLMSLGGPGDWVTAQGVTLGVFGAIVALGVHNLFDNMYVRGMTVQIGLMLALVVATWRLMETK